MRRKPQFTLFFILILAVLISSCSGDSGPSIAKAELVLDPEGTQPTTSFSWRIPFYLIIELSEFQKDTVVQASWIAVDTNRLAPETVLHIEEKTPADHRLVFALTNEGHFWPIGDFQVNIYLNGKLAQELEFEVYHTEDVY